MGGGNPGNFPENQHHSRPNFIIPRIFFSVNQLFIEEILIFSPFISRKIAHFLYIFNNKYENGCFIRKIDNSPNFLWIPRNFPRFSTFTSETLRHGCWLTRLTGTSICMRSYIESSRIFLTTKEVKKHSTAFQIVMKLSEFHFFSHGNNLSKFQHNRTSYSPE